MAMLLVLLATFKPALHQIKLLQIAKICCRKYRVVLLFARKSVHCTFYRAKANLFAASDVTPVYGVITA